MGNTTWSPGNDKTIAGHAESRLAAIFADVLRLPLDRIHPDLEPDDVERWDSVGHMALVLAIEEEFSIHFEVDEIMEFTSFQTILSALERTMAISSPEAPVGERVGT